MTTKPTPAVEKTAVRKTVAANPAPALVKTVAAPRVSKAAPKSAAAKKPLVKTPVKTVKSVKPKAAPKVKVKKPKLVRDSFTIPKPEYLVLDTLKARANAIASPAKKGELLRAGIKALAAMSDAAFLAALKAVPAIKTGRPVKV